MTAPEKLALHFTTEGYHSRSDKHSNFLCRAFIDDLLERCPKIAFDAREGNLVYKINYSTKGVSGDLNMDLAIGPPAGEPVQSDVGMREGNPVRVRIGVEAKNIMTEHKKARLNRKRDLISHATYVHSLDRNAIAAGIVVINCSDVFQSMLRKELTSHKTIEHDLPNFISEFRQLPERQTATEPDGILEARSVIVIDFGGLRGQPASVLSRLPAPQPGDNLYYEAMLRAICDSYSQRF